MRKNGGTDEPRNISLIPCKHHEAYHLIFGHMTPEKLANELNRKWIDPDYRMVAVHRERGLTVEQVLSFKEEPTPDNEQDILAYRRA